MTRHPQRLPDCIDQQVVWRTVHAHLPALKAQITALRP
jgi:uncharacterized protein with HEPN domain